MTTNRTPSDPPHKRRVVDLVCSVCGKEYQGQTLSDGRPRYCSNACRQRAAYRKLREELARLRAIAPPPDNSL